MALELNIEADRYHEVVALSASTAKHLLRSPAHYRFIPAHAGNT